MALKHNGVTNKALNYLFQNNYINIENGIIKDSEMVDNASKVSDNSKIQSTRAQIRWKKEELVKKKKKILIQLLLK